MKLKNVIMKIKKFKEHSFNLELSELKKKAKLYSDLQEEIRKIEPKATNLEELNILLNKKTGFNNARLSAMAFNQEYRYDLIVALTKETEGIEAKDLTKDYDLKETRIEAIKEKHTIYYTDEELEAKEVLDNVITAYNKLPLEYRRLIGFNYKMELMYSPLANRI